MRIICLVVFFFISLAAFFNNYITANVDNPSVMGNKEIILATTTSAQDSGLLDALIPLFEKNTGFTVKTIAVGSGQAIAMGKRGEADVLLTHSPDDEKLLIQEGAGVNRRSVMHNDFILVGPSEDKAKLKGEKVITEAFKKISTSSTLFISRGDNSGTHKKELSIWKKFEFTPSGKEWYIETGSGMGQTLNVASQKNGYCFTDRGTFLSLKKNLYLEILVQGDPDLINYYHVIEVNPEKFPKVNKNGGKMLADFFVSKEVQEIIKSFGVDKYGEPLFYPDAETVAP